MYYSNVQEVTCHLIWPGAAAVSNNAVVMPGERGMCVCIFSPLRIEAKLIENLLPLGLEDDELHFNKRPEYTIINNPSKLL